MAVELARSTYQPIRRGSFQNRSGKPNLKLIDTGKTIASKVAFEASMQKAQLNQAYWDELLEKLRKSGGGGGGGSSFDKIATSMRFMNFLSDKTIQAMLRNFTSDFTKAFNGLVDNTQTQDQNIFTVIIQKFGLVFTNAFSSVALLTGKNLNIQSMLSKTLFSATVGLTAYFSFQLNKLKEVLEEKIKELIKKLDVKEKFKLIKAKIIDIFAILENKLVETINLADVLRKKLLPFN